MPFDLDGYLARVGWTGPLDPSLATLAALMRAHMTSIPFENLDVLLGRPVRIDLESVQAKLVAGRRGGYCYEHTTLFVAVLEHLGFRAVPHSARVVLFTPREASPRTHMFLTVALDEGTFIVDPGFGGHGPRTPVPAAEHVEVRSGTDLHWAERVGGEWALKTTIGTAVVPLWMSTLEADRPIDFEMANRFTSTFPASPFVNNLMLRALSAGQRVSVMNRDVTIMRGHDVEKKTLADRAELRALLLSHFGFDLPEVERLRVPSVPEWE